jgi:hypothetical protein
MRYFLSLMLALFVSTAYAEVPTEKFVSDNPRLGCDNLSDLQYIFQDGVWDSIRQRAVEKQTGDNASPASCAYAEWMDADIISSQVVGKVTSPTNQVYEATAIQIKYPDGYVMWVLWFEDKGKVVQEPSNYLGGARVWDIASTDSLKVGETYYFATSICLDLDAVTAIMNAVETTGSGVTVWNQMRDEGRCANLPNEYTLDKIIGQFDEHGQHVTVVEVHITAKNGKTATLYSLFGVPVEP